MKRILALLVLLLGLGLSLGYSLIALNLPATPLGHWPVHTRGGGFAPVDAELLPQDAPVEVFVDLASSGSPQVGKDRAVLTLTASVSGKTALAAPLSFADAVSRDDTPQTPELIYRTRAGEFATIEPGAAKYTFTLAPGDADEIDIGGVDLVLQHGPQPADRRVAPIGYSLMAIGAIAFLLTFRKGSPATPNSQPPPPRWGRGSADT